jgi:hypothetical protein
MLPNWLAASRSGRLEDERSAWWSQLVCDQAACRQPEGGHHSRPDAMRSCVADRAPHGGPVPPELHRFPILALALAVD